MASAIFYHQHRTYDRTYLFHNKGEKTLCLKVYDLSMRCLSNRSIGCSFSNLYAFFENPISEKLLTIFSQEKALKAPPIFGDLYETIENTIHVFKTAIPLENQYPLDNQLMGLFNCPITLGLFVNPVIDDCGHTYERGAIEQVRSAGNPCPLSRGPITSLTPNLLIRQVLEAWCAQELVPTFRLFKNKNKKIAEAQMQMVQLYMSEKMYEDALKAYIQALQFTQKWEDYQQMPLLFQEMRQPERAVVAALYLAKYQMEADKLQEAIKTLETIQQQPPIDILLSSLLAYLYASQGENDKASSYALTAAKICEETDLEKAILLHKYALHYAPNNWAIYVPLGDLLTNPQERAHFFIKGACHAIEAKEINIAGMFCKLADKQHIDPLICHVYYEIALFALKEGKDEELATITGKFWQENSFQAILQQRFKILSQKQFSEGDNEWQEVKMFAQIMQPEPQKIRSELKQISFPERALGKAKWDSHFGDIGVEPALPENIYEILERVDTYGRFILALTPASIEGESLSPELLKKLVETPKTGHTTKFRNEDVSGYKYSPVKQSYWVLIGDVREESFGKTYPTQITQVETLARETGIPFGAPKLLEPTAASIIHYASTGEMLYPDVYTRCQEKRIRAPGERRNGPIENLSFGKNSVEEGFCISYAYRRNKQGGMAVVWRL